MTNSAVFLLGAGFSAPFGVPTMMPFLRSFQADAKKKYTSLYDTLAQHLSRLPDDGDIEGLLTSLGSAERLRSGLPPNMSVPDHLLQWESESRDLKAHLVSYIVEQCERFDRAHVEKVLTPLISAFAKNDAFREVHLFTTNYDRVIEHACEADDITFSDGFAESKLAAPWTRAFDGRIRLCKLHGSVTYYVDRHPRGEPIFWRLDRGYPLPGPDFRLTREGHEIEPLMVLPTLEKEALGDPYGHLNHLFVDTMARANVVVAIGTSLRDRHLVSAITYNSASIVLLVVDTEPANALARVPGVTGVPLRTDANDFLNVSRERLVGLLERCMAESDKAEIEGHVKVFAESEVRDIARWKSMTEEQRAALSAIGTGGTESVIVTALQTLYGVADARAMQVVAKMCAPSNARSVRKASAACLGLSGNPSVVALLAPVALDDDSPDVRLEAYLGLKAFGTDDARHALANAADKWPTDEYFQSVHRAGSTAA